MVGDRSSNGVLSSLKAALVLVLLCAGARAAGATEVTPISGWKPTAADPFSNNTGSISAATSLREFGSAGVSVDLSCEEEHVRVVIHTPTITPDTHFIRQSLVTTVKRRVDNDDSSEVTAYVLNPHAFQVDLSPSEVAETSGRILLGFTTDGAPIVLNLDLHDSMASSLVARCVGPWRRRQAAEDATTARKAAAEEAAQAQAAHERQKRLDAQKRYEAQRAESVAACTPGRRIKFRTQLFTREGFTINTGETATNNILVVQQYDAKLGQCIYENRTMGMPFMSPVEDLEAAD